MNKPKIEFEVEIMLDGRADASACIPEQSLYGHDTPVALITISMDLEPSRVYKGKMRCMKDTATVERVECTVFYQDQDGGDFEREYNMDDEEYVRVTSAALRQAKKMAWNVKVII